MRIGRKRIDTLKDNSVERVVSQRALQMGNSLPCQICVVGFLIGVCLTSLFLAALLTSMGTFAFGGISFCKFSNGITSSNSTSDIIRKWNFLNLCSFQVSSDNLTYHFALFSCNAETEKVIMYSQQTSDESVDERVSFLYSAWSALLDESTNSEGELPQGADQVKRSNNNVPKAPHLEDCKLSAQLNKKLDKRVENERFPPWTLWKGLLDRSSTASEQLKCNGAYPPWALRYLMRFQTEYTCNLLNVERHSAFGREAAKLVLATPAKEWLEEVTEEPQFDIERFVWSNYKPWMPRPYISMHVRMGDKASEMKLVGFEEYMNLAERIRKRFPHVHNILVSSEMQLSTVDLLCSTSHNTIFLQEVIDKLRSYPHWNFYYTNVTRQVGNTSMAAYTASLGRKTSTNYPLVNFLMAAESDFFIGALGSTWSYLIDGMRNTGGKVMAGYLSVNKDRHW
ncbi:hypothetical protein RHSIM_Rhsim09G0136400 [Rhododendron simsii]|uniref:Uncharacterized protein n=1 Tax=Rhododendron simsii TaxID=118357 RepID=A0A834GFR9_RHOSS|nr:hypothetical protein RHSIM_Rhsim09G0136400 [Rhododendron simsii]